MIKVDNKKVENVPVIVAAAGTCATNWEQREESQQKMLFKWGMNASSQAEEASETIALLIQSTG